MNRFKINEIQTYQYIIDYIKLIYNNKHNIINFLKGVDTDGICYKYTSITPNKLKSIKNFINRLNNSLLISELQQEMIDINYELIQCYIGFNNGPISTQFKNMKLEFLRKDPPLQVQFKNMKLESSFLGINPCLQIPFINSRLLCQTPFYYIETDLNNFLTENIHKFLAFNNDAEKYLNRFKLRCLQKI